MNKQDLLYAVDEILELGTGTLKGDEELSLLETWDSLAILGFIVFADEKFGLILKPEDIRGAKIVDDLITLLGNNIK